MFQCKNNIVPNNKILVNGGNIMFKRANKITALLVAAASIISIVPAMAAESTTSRLESKDGTITNAIAYSDGKYLYQGYKSSDDTDAIYYDDGNKDKALDDLSSADLNTTYSDKYAFANDGSDQYLVDLTSGDVSDSTTPVDDIDTAATKLQTKLKKTNRYGNSLGDSLNGTISVTDLEAGQAEEDNKVLAIPENKFGDTWYSYKVKTASSDGQNYVADYTTSGNTKTGYLYGFTNTSGKYIDASYTANIYAYSTKEGKTVKISNFSNNFDDVDSDSELLATLVQQPVALAQDKDYIYALVTVDITDKYATKGTGATTTSASAVISDASGVTTTRTYIQKISKVQGDQENDAYLPKTVETYEIGNVSNNEYDSTDASDASAAVLAAIKDTDAGSSVSKLSDVTQEMVIGRTSTNKVAKPIFTVNNSNLIAIKAGTDSIDAVTLKFKKDKLKYKSDNLPQYKSTSAALSSSTKVDAYLVEKDSDDSVDLTRNISNYDQYSAYDIDVDGNVWIATDGKIYKYENGNMTKVYTCDSSLDSLSVYDANNLIAWTNSGNIYTTISEGTAQDTADTTATATTVAKSAKVGWNQLADGTWYFNDATGSKVVSKWINDGGVWYYLKADGAMATGWLNDNETWYYLKSSGAMATGWLNDKGTWYYLNGSGAMLSNTTVDVYILGASGAWIQ